jgi:hypothetical protein
LCTDVQAVTNTKVELQYPLYTPTSNTICMEHNFKLSTSKTEVMAFKGSENKAAKIISDTRRTEYVTECSHIGCSVSYVNNYTKLQQATETLILMWEKI